MNPERPTHLPRLHGTTPEQSEPGATGYDIHKVALKQSADDEKISPSREDEEKWIQDAGINTVIDIGAHSGGFSRHFRRLLPNAHISAFEPLPLPYFKLIEVMKGDLKFEAFQHALGDKPGLVEMSENEHTYSSSVLPIAERHRKDFPFTSQTRPISVDIRRLDDINLDLKNNVLSRSMCRGSKAR